MKNTFEYKGIWFLPSDKSKRVTGILSYDIKSRSTLELFGNFCDDIFNISMGQESIILGVTSDSKHITLYRCFVSKTGGQTLRQGKEIGFGSTVYTVNFIFEGAHINSVEEMKFQTMNVSIHNLDEWVGVTGFIRESPSIDKLKNFETAIKYKLPEPIEFKIDSKVDAKFNFTATTPGLSRYDKELAIKQKVYLVLHCELGFNLEAWLDYLNQFQGFLLMGLYNNTYPTEIIFNGSNFYDQHNDDKISLHKIEFYHSDTSREAKPIKSDFEMLFSYQDIQLNFQLIITNWFVKYQLLNPTCDLVFGQFYNNKIFSENTFLNLAQAAETFHLRTNNRTKIPKNEYKEMQKEILQNVDKKHHSWLKEQFNFGNNLNLAERLDGIIKSTSNPLLDMIIGDKKLFADQIRWTRNYYTHYTQSGKKKALKGMPLYRLSEKLKIVLVCAFLKEIGFSIEEIEELLRGIKGQFNHLIAANSSML